MTTTIETKRAADLQPGDRIPPLPGFVTYRTVTHVERRGKAVRVFCDGDTVPLRLSFLSMINVEVIG